METPENVYHPLLRTDINGNIAEMIIDYFGQAHAIDWNLIAKAYELPPKGRMVYAVGECADPTTAATISLLYDIGVGFPFYRPITREYPRSFEHIFIRTWPGATRKLGSLQLGYYLARKKQSIVRVRRS